MKRLILTAAMLAACSSLSYADDMPGSASHKRGGLGFHNIQAPVGFRWWFTSQKVGLDLGVGFVQASAASDGYPDDNLLSWAFDAGVPFVIHSWSRAHVLLRPGVLYESDEFTTTSPPTAFDTDNTTTLSITGEVEAEVFLVDNVSLSASTGIAYVSFDPGSGADSQSAFGTFGNNFTQIGFHVYFFGGNQ